MPVDEPRFSVAEFPAGEARFGGGCSDAAGTRLDKSTLQGGAKPPFWSHCDRSSHISATTAVMMQAVRDHGRDSFFVYNPDFYSFVLSKVLRFPSGFGELDLQLQPHRTKVIRLISSGSVCGHPENTEHSARGSAVGFAPFKDKTKTEPNS